MGVMEGSCVGYRACNAAEHNSGFVGDVTGSCGNKTRVCGYAAALLEISPTDRIVRVRSRAYWSDSKHEYQSDNRNDSPGHSQQTEHRPLSLP